MKNIFYIFVFCIFVAILAMPFFDNASVTRYFEDETSWLLASRHFKLLELDGLPIDSINTPNCKGWILRELYDQPPAGKYIFIIGSYLLGLNIEDINLLYWESKSNDYRKDMRYNTSRNAVPRNDTLFSYRYITAFFGVLACLLVFLIGRMVFDNYTGLLAAVFMAYNPLMIESSTRIMVDTIVVFFICLSFYLMAVFFKLLLAKRYAMASAISVFAGVAAALAVGTKLNGGIAFVTFIIFCLFVLAGRIALAIKNREFSARWILKDAWIKTVIISVFIFIITTAAVFIAINPFLYSHPIKNINLMLVHRIETAKEQGITYNAALSNFKARALYIWDVMLSCQGYPTLFANRYKIPVYLILFLIGFFATVIGEIRHILKNGGFSLRITLLAWFLVTFIVLLYTLLLNWSRYLLPLLPPIALFAAYSIGGLKRKNALNKI